MFIEKIVLNVLYFYKVMINLEFTIEFTFIKIYHLYINGRYIK